MKFKTVILLMLLVVILSAITIAHNLPITVVDDRGHEITIEKIPQRIVVAGTPLYTEILLDIGAHARLVGISDSPDNPPEAASIQKVGPQFEPNLELVVSLKPDVVFGIYGDKREALENMGITVISTGFIERISDIFTTTRVVGKVVGNLDEADALIGRISEEIIRIEEKVLTNPKPTVAMLYASTADTPPWGAGNETPENELMKRAGGKNVFSDIEGYKQISFEEIVERNPEFIFTDSAQISNIKENKHLKKIKAILNDQVVGIKASAMTSTRVAEVLKVMAESLHPEAFEK